MIYSERSRSAERERLTITMRRDLLHRVDEVIDGAQIRNRSHAIEYLLTNALPPSVSKAFILAGGPGVKMRPLTYELPKTMIPVNGRPILEHIINLLRENGIREVVVLAGPQADKIRTYFGDGSKFGVKMEYIVESRRLGTAGALKAVRAYAGSKSFFVFHGDVLVDINLKDMITFHQGCGKPATIAVTSVDRSSDWGVIGLQGSSVVSFTEKPQKSGMSHNINAGVYIMEPEIFELLPKTAHMLEQDLFPALAKNRKLCGYLFEGQWFDISTPEVYEQALKQWKK